LKKNHNPSLRSWDGVCFYNTERTLNNACIRVDKLYRGNKKMHIHKQRYKIYKLGMLKKINYAHHKYLQSMKNHTFDYSTDEESKDFGNESSFSEDDEDMLMVKYLYYKLRSRKASESRSQAQKSEKKKARKAILEQPGVEDESGSSNHICRNRLKSVAFSSIVIKMLLFSSKCTVDIFSCSPLEKYPGSLSRPFKFVSRFFPSGVCSW
jgi:hypothetical protein